MKTFKSLIAVFKRLFAISVFAAPAGLLAAGTVCTLRVHVPFAFVAAGKSFAPGTYVVESQENGIVSLQGDGKGVMTLSLPANTGAPAANPGLVFSNVNKHEYLVGVDEDSTANSRTIPVRAAEVAH